MQVFIIHSFVIFRTLHCVLKEVIIAADSMPVLYNYLFILFCFFFFSNFNVRGVGLRAGDL